VRLTNERELSGKVGRELLGRTSGWDIEEAGLV